VAPIVRSIRPATGYLENTMTLLQLTLDGALAAAELLALLFAPPAAAHEPATLAAPAAFERPAPYTGSAE
jgi:hypothetical protein